MFVKTYTVDKVIQNKVTFETKQFEDVNLVKELIKLLNGSTITTITFEHSSNLYLCVCGANDNFVLYTVDDKSMLIPVINNNLFSDEVIINTSGNLCKFSKDLVLDLETVVNIVKVYVETGNLNDKSVKWVNLQEWYGM
jgi:hypothetical protein